MIFIDHQIPLELFGKLVTVLVKADLIHLFWGAHTGPQTAEGIIDANIDVIRALAEEKFINGSKGEIEISAIDYETGEDDAGEPLDPEEAEEVRRQAREAREAITRRIH